MMWGWKTSSTCPCSCWAPFLPLISLFALRRYRLRLILSINIDFATVRRITEAPAPLGEKRRVYGNHCESSCPLPT